jgi:hypothetical protein
MYRELSFFMSQVVDKSTYKNLKIKRKTNKEEENPKLKTKPHSTAKVFLLSDSILHWFPFTTSNF